MLSPALRSRAFLASALAALVISVTLYSRLLPHAFVSVRHETMPLPVHPTQYAPIALSIILALSLTSRFDLWDRLGTRRVSLLALTCAAITTLLPPLLVWGFPMSDDFPTAYTLGISANVFVLACLCYLEISLLGRLWGTITAGATVWGLYALTSEVSHVAQWGPLTMLIDSTAQDASSAVLTNPRWPWLTLLAIITVFQAWSRRGLPLKPDFLTSS